VWPIETYSGSQKFSTGGVSVCSIHFCPFPFSCPTKSAIQSKNNRGLPTKQSWEKLSFKLIPKIIAETTSHRSNRKPLYAQAVVIDTIANIHKFVSGVILPWHIQVYSIAPRTYTVTQKTRHQTLNDNFTKY